ncbi:MAG: VanZ family protein [Candidatus Binataceae bacterium]|nr:VanZ family protein [Candidatus Binataceae bacterium]
MSTSIFTFTNTWMFVGEVLHWLFPAGTSESNQVLIHLIARKGAHFGAYAIFFMVLMYGPLRARPYWALLVCLALATADETHQMFLPDRTASPYDVAIDMTGALFARFLYLASAQV